MYRGFSSKFLNFLKHFPAIRASLQTPNRKSHIYMQCQSASHHHARTMGVKPKSSCTCRTVLFYLFWWYCLFYICNYVGTNESGLNLGLKDPAVSFNTVYYRITVPFQKTKWCHPGRNIKTSLTFSVGTAPRTNPHGPCFQRCAGCKRWADEVVATIPKKVLKSNMSTGPLKLKRSKTYL